MHPLYQKADQLSQVAIGSAIEVHRLKGPGLIESIYERCLMRELELRKVAAVNQRLVRIEYKGLQFDEPLRFDVLIEACLLLELKCTQEILPIHRSLLATTGSGPLPSVPDHSYEQSNSLQTFPHDGPGVFHLGRLASTDFRLPAEPRI